MTVLGEFVVERELGHGGFGEVVLAASRRTGDQYAVKRVHRDDPVEQGRFLTEAQRWIGLPYHPHITPCHFTRTVGNQMAVFSEYAVGGSLADWIVDGRLYADGPRETLRTVLRIAVEAAWGLDAAHTHGLLHLDTKPSNVLLTERATAKITDFGLAAGTERDPKDVIAREFAVDLLARPGDGIDAADSEVLKAIIREVMGASEADEISTLRAMAEGITPGYASPEQAEGRPLGRRADLWSWAVTVLEMFTGGRTWPTGTVAGAALEAFLNDGACGPVEMPDGVVGLLRACFRLDPDERPRSLREPADGLVRTAARECGFTLDGEPPQPQRRTPTKGGFERRLPGGASWQDPRDLLGIAYQAAGQDPGNAVRFWPSGHGSRASQAMEDLRALTEATRVLDTVDTPDQQLLYLRAFITAQSGRVRHGLGDLSGAVHAYRTSAQALEALDLTDARLLRLDVLHSLAIVLRLSGSPVESVAICDLLVDSAASLQDSVEAARIRGKALSTKANAVDDPGEQVQLNEQAIADLRTASEDEGVAIALANLAGALEQARRGAEATAVWDQADDLIRQATAPGRSDLEAVRAGLHLNRAITAKDPQDKAAYAQVAVELYEPLVHERGRHDIAGHFGHALLLTGRGHEHADRPQEALAAYRSARSMLEQAVLRDGRLEYVQYLAQASDHESTLAGWVEDRGSAVALARRAIDMWDRLNETDGRRSWVAERADARRKLADSLLDAGETADAAQEYDETLCILQSAPGRDANTRVIEALVHNGQAVLHRRTGAPDVACQKARAALDIIGLPTRPREEEARVLCLQTLSAALGNMGQYEDALSIADTLITEVGSLVERGEASRRDLADARQRRVNSLVRLGYITEALAAASQALEDFQHLIDAGHTDLVTEAARLRGALAVALQRSGDLDGAARTMQAIRREFAEQTTYPWHRIFSHDDAETAAALGTDVHSLILEGFDARLTDMAEIQAVNRRHLHRMLTTFAQRGEDLISAPLWAAEPEQASEALEDICGSLLWLATKYPQDTVHETCARTALLLGITSMRCDRTGAAQRGFRLAIEHGRILVIERGRTEHLDNWANAHLALASWQATRGDDKAAARTVSDMKTHLATLAPSHLANWSAQTQQLLASIRTSKTTFHQDY